MFGNKSQTSIDAATARARAALQDREKIQRALQAAETELPQARERVRLIEAQLGEEEAAAALSDGEPTPRDNRTVRSLSKERDAVTALEALLAGLRARLAKHDEELLAAHDELRAARDAFAQEQIVAYAAELRKAVATLAPVLRKGYALAAGLNVGWLDSQLDECRVPNPEDNGDLLSRGVLDGTTDLSKTWAEDGKAQAAHEAATAVMELARTLEGLAGPLARRRDDEQQAEAFARRQEENQQRQREREEREDRAAEERRLAALNRDRNDPPQAHGSGTGVVGSIR